MKIKRISAIIGLLVVLSLLAACGSAQNPTATTDPKLIYTQVAETVQAQMTKTGAASILTPKATDTELPTEVPPTAALTQGTVSPTTAGTQPTGKATVAGTTSGTAAATLVVLPTNTGQVPTAPEKMLYISQTVKDGTIFKAGDQFTQSWVIKNVGTTTWPNTYRVRFYGGNRFGVDDFTLPGTIIPNQTVTLTVHMTAPANVGKYNSIWVMTNNDGVNFGFFTFNLEVK
ncbi:MAG TPA: NBR1-Ig-like domain-containing protein [Anaerolineaceae bacterium]|nr:NBR1-Ig-like domain-containing protein [Anaerolineaceae bacterium]